MKRGKGLRLRLAPDDTRHSAKPVSDNDLAIVMAGNSGVGLPLNPVI